MSMRIGFMGLGEMGRWMALNIMKAGFPLLVFDIDPRAVQLLTPQGAEPTRSPAEMASRADCVFLSLPDTAAVEKVTFAEGGIAQGALPGLLVVDCGTTSYMQTLQFARRLRDRGVTFADAPVSGMEARARDGTLTIMFGGEEDVFHRLRPALDAMGKDVIFMGAVGSGQLAKLVNQLLFNISAAAIAEVLPMAGMLGLDPEKVVRVITTGTGRSFAAEFFAPLILENRFDQGYPLKNAYKDMISAMEICVHQRIPLPLTHAATTTYQMALADGHGDENKGAMIKVFERILGVAFRRKGAA